MKKTIRYGVFETNSSSVHTVTIKGHAKYISPPLKVSENDNKVHITPDCFGWYYDGNYEGSEMKLSYLATMIVAQSGFDYADNNDYFMLDELIRKHCNCDGLAIDALDDDFYSKGYIDHQSYHSSINNFLLLECDGMSLGDFIFNDNVDLHISNDNNYE